MNNSLWLKWGFAAAATGLACSAAMAQQARVISTVAVQQQVGVPQQVCGDEQVYAGQRTTGAGAVIGAIIGGVAGSALGGGHGPHGHGPARGATTAIGAITGGLIGNQVEGTTGGTPAYQNVRRCTTETVYENRTVGYDVTYEYAGQRYTARMDRDPGQWVTLNMQPQTTYNSVAPSNGSFVGPSGVYNSAPAEVTVTETVTYPAPAVPIVVGVDVGPYAPPPPMWHRPPPPPPHHHWR